MDPAGNVFQIPSLVLRREFRHHSTHVKLIKEVTMSLMLTEGKLNVLHDMIVASSSKPTNWTALFVHRFTKGENH
jgi:hypothetical protein